MSPLNRRLALTVGIALLVAAGYAAWAVVSARDAERPAMTPAELPDGGPGGLPSGSEPTSSAEQSRTPGSSVPAREGDQVPDEAAYDLIDALATAGISPVMGTSLTLTYVELLDTVRVSGQFENTTTSSYVLEYEDGAWKVKK